ncbi:tyrosine-type recombinase/integrase [Microbacterium sp. 22242]|uniref:tyrosine-type recombinase/integrase n=1 Tax=Microbacterium sp. 22242 TaxID=3453896 RepID=UPI003F87F64F
MSAELVVAPRHGPVGASRRSWPEFLEEALLATWRAGEWDSGSMMFTGDPANPRTAVSVCITPSCSVIVDGGTRVRCQSCRKRKSRWTMADGDFDAEYNPRFRLDSPTEFVFSLADVTPVVRSEILYGLQQREKDSNTLRPRAVTAMVKQIGRAESILDVAPTGKALWVSYLRSVQTHVRRLRSVHAGRDGTEGEVWDCALVGLFSARDRTYRAVKGHLDFTVIRQAWLRDVVLGWARAVRPTVADARQTLHAAEIASLALTGRPHGEHPEQLMMADMSVVFDALAAARNPSSQEIYSLSHRQSLIGRWRGLIQFGRTAGLMDEVPGTFALPPDRRLPSVRSQEDELGRAIPEEWIVHLDGYLELLGADSTFSNNGWRPEDYAAQYQVVYQLIRDTGRRPSEIVSLKRDAVEYHDGDPCLVYDNRKAGRLGRRLPIDPSTALIVNDWAKRVSSLLVPQGAEAFLFPAPGARGRERRGHLRPGQFARVFRDWVDALPFPDSLSPDAERFRREDIEPYGLRHAYAQRHADNGTKVDVLRELMDHRDLATTMGYYKVSLKRKQEAVRLLSKYATDRHGHRAPFASPLAYERSSIAVPFGNCTEPKNVQAGGKACPLRFQCAGCGFFRPDPSYLEAIDAHVAQLRVDKELAFASDAAGWIIANIDEQITAFSDIAAALRAMVSDLPVDEQDELAMASKIVRRERGAATFIPLDSVGRRPDAR